MLTSVWERGKDAWLLGYHVACQGNKRRLTVSDFNLLVSVLFRVSIFFFYANAEEKVHNTEC